MVRGLLWFLLMVFVVADVAEEEDMDMDSPMSGGYLLVHQKMDAKALAVNVNMTVQLRLMNVGQGPVYDVEVASENYWPEEYFRLIEGERTHTFDMISAGETEEYTFTLQPMQTMQFVAAPAIVTYRPESGADKTTTKSNFYPMQNQVFTEQAYNRYGSSREMEKSVFHGALVLLVVLPLLWQFHLSRSYVNGVPVELVKSKMA